MKFLPMKLERREEVGRMGRFSLCAAVEIGAVDTFPTSSRRCEAPEGGRK
jgi:hypothetical protein